MLTNLLIYLNNALPGLRGEAGRVLCTMVPGFVALRVRGPRYDPRTPDFHPRTSDFHFPISISPLSNNNHEIYDIGTEILLLQ